MLKYIKVLCFLMVCCLLLSQSVIFQQQVKAQVQEGTTLKVPEKVRVKSYKGKKLRLSWKQVEEAEGYVVQEYKSSKKKFVKVAETTGTKTGWTSAETKKKRIYRVCAYRMENGKKVMGNYSYEVSAIPYKKKSKFVNAGEVQAKQYQIKLGLRETEQMEVTVKNSRFAKNKKAKLIDNKLRWYTTDPSVATVSEKGVVTAQGNTQTGKISMKIDRSDLEVTSSKMSFGPIKKNILKVINDYSGNMKIRCYSNGVRFDLSDGIYHLEVVYLFKDVSSDFEETINYFWVAPRWMCEFYRYPA